LHWTFAKSAIQLINDTLSTVHSRISSPPTLLPFTSITPTIDIRADQNYKKNSVQW